MSDNEEIKPLCDTNRYIPIIKQIGYLDYNDRTLVVILGYDGETYTYKLI